MTCKLCGREGRLIKAHVIPEAFFRAGREKGDRGRPPILASTNPGIPPKRTPIGVYDPDILCEHCETLFQDWDDYGSRLLLDEFLAGAQELRSDNETLAFVLDRFDYSLLKLFVISVVWRAAVSTQSFYENVTLGPYADIAKQALLNADPGGSDSFATFFGRWKSSSPRLDSLTNILISPFKEKIEGVNTIRVYLGPFVAYVKTDKRLYPDHFRHAQIAQNSRLIAIVREVDHSDDFSLMKKIGSNLEDWRSRPRK